MNTCDDRGFSSLRWVLGFLGGEIMRLSPSVSRWAIVSSSVGGMSRSPHPCFDPSMGCLLRERRSWWGMARSFCVGACRNVASLATLFAS